MTRTNFLSKLLNTDTQCDVIHFSTTLWVVSSFMLCKAESHCKHFKKCFNVSTVNIHGDLGQKTFAVQITQESGLGWTE